ncbi:MAG: hypothetical protein ABEJ48_08275 [Halobacteriales archaeon]
MDVAGTAPAWVTAVATAIGYLVLLGTLTLLFFVVPTVVFGIL